MLQRNREVDGNFKGWHQLYRRCEKEDIIGDRLNPSRIKYANTSVNWSKYSKPWDVVFDHPKQGIAQLSVHHLPTELPKKPPAGAKPVLHSFLPEHYPEQQNYSHSQIMTFKAGVKLVKPELPATVKKEFRTIVSDRSLILLMPDI